jgi:transposase-like protein
MAHGEIPRKEPILMEKRKWTSQQKLQIVLEGLSGQIEISKLCAKYQVSQAQYYKWRDQLLKHGTQAFEIKDVTKKEQHLQLENQKLRRIIGDLTVELKKTEIELQS